MAKIGAAQIARSSFWLTASFMLAKFAQFISQIVLARILSPEEFGVWAMVLILTVLTDLFRDKAVAQVLVQRGLDNKSIVNAVYSLGVNLSIAMFVVQTLIGIPLSYVFGRAILFPLIAVMGLKFLIGAGAGAHGAVLQQTMRFRELALSDALSGVARLLGGVVSAWLGAGVWSFAIAEISMAIADSVSKRSLSGYSFTYQLRPDPDAVKNVQGYIKSLIGINLAVYLNTNGDNFVVGKLLGATPLGYYNLAYQLAMLPNFALAQFNRVSLSVLSQRDDAGKRKLLFKSLELHALLYAPLYGIAAMSAPWLIPLLYGKAWLACIPIFQYILVYSYTRGIMQTLGTTLNALDKPDINARINWTLVPISLVGFWLGAQWMGVNGVAIAAALIMGVGAVIWFQIITCKVTNWRLLDLLSSGSIPTFSMLISYAIVQVLPPQLFPAIEIGKFILQPIYFLLLYGFLITILSAGRIPKLLFQTIRSIKK